MHDHLHLHQRSAAQNSSRNALQVQESKRKKKVEKSWSQLTQTSHLLADYMQSMLQAAPAQPCRMQLAGQAIRRASKHTPTHTHTHTSSHTHWRKGDQQGVSVCRCFCRDELKTGGGVGWLVSCFLLSCFLALLDSTRLDSALEHEGGLGYCSSK
ncbi:uncharacterized protein BO88DRAFT_3092 [Aspergillus vadensis CBS 113365]|uniref:Uncharacterized protein n=1 Tax=Aspergillus vadensis (strain CBS 113365 / IMI 142717 / IBT 24658) TaxID=1448311 RepID=A0A319BNY5_ASPVC|nr:hypothetical protein BO88DRAFT_3092 [Aspergillus vadensis CBS 113365]PYH74101.1 hypothetical protein BO88DRAFT_3092 [Aspergillus vadensis CBS 113365]